MKSRSRFHISVLTALLLLVLLISGALTSFADEKTDDTPAVDTLLQTQIGPPAPANFALPPAAPPAEGGSVVGIARLKADTGDTAQVSINDATGVAKFVSLVPGSVDYNLSNKSSAGASAQANAFLKAYGSAFGISDVEAQLVEANVADNHAGGYSVSYQQVDNGLPVFAGVLRVHFDAKGNLFAANGTFVPDIKVNTDPSLDSAEAEKIATQTALNFADENDVKVKSAELSADVNLLVFRSGLVQGISGINHLAYQVEVRNDSNLRYFVYVDAHSGNVIDQYSAIHVIDRELSEGNLANVIWVEGDPDPIPAGWAGGSAQQVTDWQNEADGAIETYNLFSSMTGASYISYDGADATMRTVNNDPSINCPNANWNGTSTNYCSGVTGDDTVAHEWGHAYTDFTNNLIYQWQSGALNESYSDIWGDTVDLINGRGTDTPDVVRAANVCSSNPAGNNVPGWPTVDTVRWLSGEDDPAFGGAIRDLWAPQCYGDPGHSLDVANYWCAAGDGGGVHTNSGVPNHGFALMVDGGTYTNSSGPVSVNGIGLTKAAHIHWMAQNMLTPASDFSDHANALANSCQALIGQPLFELSTALTSTAVSAEVISAADCTEVANVIDAVEFHADVTAQCGFTSILDPNAPPLCPVGRTVDTITNADWESGMPAGWSVGTRDVANPATFDTPDWAIAPNGTNHPQPLPDGLLGSAMFVEDNPAYGDCAADTEAGVLYLESPIVALDTDDPYLAFDHWVATEAGWDGGNLKARVNGGPWQVVPSSDYTFNPYNATLQTVGAGNDNPMAGEEAFSGTDGGQIGGSWGQSQVDLSNIAGDGDFVQLRFEMGLDGCNGVIGWYVDDVNLYQCVPAGTALVEGYITDSTTGWPLYAEVTVNDGMAQTVFSNPATGYYSATVASGVNVNINVTSLIMGYDNDNASVGPLAENSTAQQDFALDADLVACTAPGYQNVTAFAEDFDSAPFPPSGWTSIDNEGNGVTWFTSTTWGDGNYTGGTGEAATVNSDVLPGEFDTELHTPSIDVSSLPAANLVYKANYQNLAGLDFLDLDINVDNGGWVNLLSWNEDHGALYSTPGEVVSLDLSSQLTGATNFVLRWHYYDPNSGDWDWYAQIDDVVIGSACTPPASGNLVMGYTNDANTSAPVNNASVDNEDGFSGMSMATVADPALNDGFYYLFSPPGTKTFTATAANYGDDVDSVSVASSPVWHNFDLPAGWLDANPDSLAITLTLGLSGTLPLDIDNIGGADVDVELAEAGGDFNPSKLAGEDILIVNEDNDATNAFKTALDNLGYTYIDVTNSTFTGMAVNDLLAYKGVIYAGIPSVGAEQNQAMAYLDAGGNFMMADNDIGWNYGGTVFYSTYFQADYVSDAGSSGVLTGLDILSGINPDISADPFPDDFTLNGPESAGILEAPSTNLAGSRTERNGYKAVYFAFDYDSISGSPDGTDVLGPVLGWLVNSDVPWLSEDPITFTVSAAGSQAVNVTFDAGVPEVTQPGDYSAIIKAKNNAPYASLDVPVEMTVLPSADLGKLNGVVNSLGYCENDPAPLETTVWVTAAGFTETMALETDANGYYSYWLRENDGPFTATVGYADHVTQTVTGINITGLATTTVDIDLQLEAPCLTVNPDQFAVTLELGLSTTLPMTVSNSGLDISNFRIEEVDGGFVLSKAGPAVKVGPSIIAPANYGQGSLERQATPGATSSAAPAKANGNPVQDGSFEDGSPNAYWNEYSLNFGTPLCDPGGCGTGGGTGPLSGDWWVWFGGIAAYEEGSVDQNVTVPVDYDTLSFWLEIPSFTPGSGDYMQVWLDGSLLFTADESVAANFGTYTRVVVNIAPFADGGVHNLYFYAETFGAGTTNFFVDDVAISAGVPWLSQNPITGTLTYPSYSGTVLFPTDAVIDVTFDAGKVDQPGTYYADMNIKDDSGYDGPTVPAELTVVAPGTWGKLAGTVTALEYCGNNPHGAEASVYLEYSNGTTQTVQTDSNGYYQRWFGEGLSPLTATVMYAGHLSQTVTGVSVTAGLTTTLDFDLEYNGTCVQVDPTSVTSALGEDDSKVETLVISNTGAVDLDWDLAEEATAPLLPIRPSAVVETAALPADLIAIGDNSFSISATPAQVQSKAASAPSQVSYLGVVTLTQSLDQSVVPGSISCNAAGLHADNSYIRVFDLPSYGIVTDFTVSNVQIGVETAAAGSGGVQPITVNLYTLSGPLTYANMTLIGTVDTTVADQTLTIVDIPVTGTAPAGSTLVVEVFTPDGQASGHSFFVGSNAGGQTAPSYLSAPSCGAVEPTDIATLGFPNMHIVMNVVGSTSSICETLDDIPWIAGLSPVSGTVVAGGDQSVDVTFDSTGYGIGTYDAHLCLASNDPVRPNVVVPVSMQVLPSTPTIDFSKTVGTDANACADTDSVEVASGSEVTYCYEVQNVSAVDLDLHNVVDDQLGTVLSATYNLGPLETYWFTASTVITEDTTNTAVWTAYNSGTLNLPAVATDTATVDVVNPAISLVKTVGTDAAVCATTNDIVVGADDSLTFCYTVTNNGDADLTMHDLADAYPSLGFSGSSYLLEPGQSLSQKANLATSAGESLGLGTNVLSATWTAYTDSYSADASDVATVTVLSEAPSISLSKTVGTDANACATTDSIGVTSGTEVTYCYSVLNTSVVTFTIHSLTDDQLGGIITDAMVSLAPNATYWITTSTTLSDWDAVGSTYLTQTVNTGIWTASDGTVTNTVTAQDTATVYFMRSTIYLPLVMK